MNAGRNLRARREALGLRLRDVEAASKAIAARRDGDTEYVLPISQISYIESRELVGCKIKGVRRLLENLRNFGVSIEPNDGSICLNLCFGKTLTANVIARQSPRSGESSPRAFMSSLRSS